VYSFSHLTNFVVRGGRGGIREGGGRGGKRGGGGKGREKGRLGRQIFSIPPPHSAAHKRGEGGEQKRGKGKRKEMRAPRPCLGVKEEKGGEKSLGRGESLEKGGKKEGGRGREGYVHLLARPLFALI